MSEPLCDSAIQEAVSSASSPMMLQNTTPRPMLLANEANEKKVLQAKLSSTVDELELENLEKNTISSTVWNGALLDLHDSLDGG